LLAVAWPCHTGEISRGDSNSDATSNQVTPIITRGGLEFNCAGLDSFQAALSDATIACALDADCGRAVLTYRVT
jgi:glucose dehydrogenase